MKLMKTPGLLRLLALTALLGDSCKGFVGSATTQPRALFRKIMMSATMEKEELAVTPNWRPLRCDCSREEICKVISRHERWGEREYAESLDLYDKFMACDDSYVAPLIKDALGVLESAFRLYGPDSVICSFNGGKDAVVILHLVRAAQAHFFKQSGSKFVSRPRVVYFGHQEEFPEVLTLLEGTVKDYDLDMIAFEEGTKFQDGLKTLVDNNESNGSRLPMAFVLGTRSTDPNAGSQGNFAPSSTWMPPFMRVNPILDWTYGHVWHFTRQFHLPYCSLYDIGYTSLGTTKDTFPCPALAVAGASSSGGVPKFWPAYMLRDWSQERAGRVKKEKKANKAKQTDTENSSSQRSITLSTTTDLGAAEAKAPVSSVNVQLEEASPSQQSTISLNSNASMQRTVGLLIIGDEILKGITADTNTLSAAQALRAQNVLLAKVVVVSDDPEDIVEEIHRMQRDVDVIITSGGVGPTHDDVTIKSVASALGQEMVLNGEMAQLLKDKMDDGDDDNDNRELTDAQIKMAMLPSNAKLRYLTDNEKDWPFLQCRNIFILPGVPQFFTKKVQTLSAYLSSQLERSVSYKVVLSVDEASIVDALNEVVARHEHVSFGSYPFVDHAFKTVVTLESRMIRGLSTRNSTIILDRSEHEGQLIAKEEMDQNVQKALDDLIDSLPRDSILRVDNNDGVLFS